MKMFYIKFKDNSYQSISLGEFEFFEPDQEKLGFEAEVNQEKKAILVFNPMCISSGLFHFCNQNETINYENVFKAILWCCEHLNFDVYFSNEDTLEKAKIENKVIYKRPMSLSDFINQSARTFANQQSPLSERTLDLLHCVMGASTEANELLDQFKKHIFYKKDLDLVNIKEEIGDQMWYLANLVRLLGFDFEEIFRTNIDKLKIRYPEKFDSEKALNRDLDKEREILEK